MGILKRLRGLFGTALAWSAGWSLVGLALGALAWLTGAIPGLDSGPWLALSYAGRRSAPPAERGLQLSSRLQKGASNQSKDSRWIEQRAGAPLEGRYFPLFF